MQANKMVAAAATKLKLKSSRLPILHKAKVEKGRASITNLDTSVIVDVGSESDEGYLDPALFGKTGNLAISMTPFGGAGESEEFPTIPSGTEKTPVPACLFTKKLKTIASFASKDQTRFCLCGVSFEKKKQWIAATDGHVLMLERVAEIPCSPSGYSIPEDFILSTEAIEILGVFGFEVQSATIFSTPTIVSNPPEAETPTAPGRLYIQFKGDGWEVISKLIEGPYPDIERVFPPAKGKVQYDVVKRDALVSAINAVLPIASTKTQLVRLDSDGYVKVANKDLEKFWKRKAGGEVISSHIPEIGFNASMLKQVLGSMTNEGFEMCFGETNIQGIMLNQRSRSTLVMPLRILKEGETVEPIEYTEI